MDSERKVNQLLKETEALLAQLADQPQLADRQSPEIRKLRDKLETSIARAKGAAPPRRRRRHVKVRDVAASFNDYVHHFPWVALATGVLVASTVGILATGATKRSLNP
jgi:ElaB/YqjD/DUF883 family membrane-anchored ribosome-binding protein